MPVRSAEATWTGTIGEGEGTVALGSGAYEGGYSVGSRFEEEPGTNPEELIAAAHAGCFAMALSAALTEAGYEPERIDATADVTVEKVGDDWAITTIDLAVEAAVPDIDTDEFQAFAEGAKENCPVSQALASVENVTLNATLA